MVATMRPLLAPPCLALALLTACGDSGNDDTSPTTPTTATTPGTQSAGDTTAATATTTTTTATSSADDTTTAPTSTPPTTTIDPDSTGPESTTLTTADDTTTGGDPDDPFGPPPPMNLWPAGPSDHMTPSGTPFHVEVPAGDTSAALLVIGGFSVNQMSNADNAITIAVTSDGVLGPKACPPGMSGVPHNLFADVIHEVLIEAGKNVQFDHKRAFVEADGNNSGYGMTAGLDPINQPFLAGIYVPWAEYNCAPCKGVTTPAGANSPKTLFISKNACDDTYCPLKDCIGTVQALGYDVTFSDPLGPNTCDCVGACPGQIERPHFKGPGDPGPIKPWVLATVKP